MSVVPVLPNDGTIAVKVSKKKLKKKVNPDQTDRGDGRV